MVELFYSAWVRGKPCCSDRDLLQRTTNKIIRKRPNQPSIKSLLIADSSRTGKNTWMSKILLLLIGTPSKMAKTGENQFPFGEKACHLLAPFRA
jgi:hypothetical protein